MPIERTATGIAGLDEMLGGGIPRSYTVLLAGGPGSGKSTLAMQYLVNGVEKHGENGIYITLEEKPEDILRNFSAYGWNLNKIKIISMIPQKATLGSEVKYVLPQEQRGNYLEFAPKKFSVDLIKDVIARQVQEADAKRMVIDSIASFSIQFSDAFEIRQEILGLSNLLNELRCTSFLLTEMPEGSSGISRFGIEEFVCQGVIALYNIKKGSERVRGLEILKMRGTKHSKKICMMDILDSGVVVYPQENLHREGY